MNFLLSSLLFIWVLNGNPVQAQSWNQRKVSAPMTVNKLLAEVMAFFNRSQTNQANPNTARDIEDALIKGVNRTFEEFSDKGDLGALGTFPSKGCSQLYKNTVGFLGNKLEAKLVLLGSLTHSRNGPLGTVKEFVFYDEIPAESYRTELAAELKTAIQSGTYNIFQKLKIPDSFKANELKNFNIAQNTPRNAQALEYLADFPHRWRDGHSILLADAPLQKIFKDHLRLYFEHEVDRAYAFSFLEKNSTAKLAGVWQEVVEENFNVLPQDLQKKYQEVLSVNYFTNQFLGKYFGFKNQSLKQNYSEFYDSFNRLFSPHLGDLRNGADPLFLFQDNFESFLTDLELHSPSDVNLLIQNEGLPLLPKNYDELAETAIHKIGFAEHPSELIGIDNLGISFLAKRSPNNSQELLETWLKIGWWLRAQDELITPDQIRYNLLEFLDLLSDVLPDADEDFKKMISYQLMLLSERSEVRQYVPNFLKAGPSKQIFFPLANILLDITRIRNLREQDKSIAMLLESAFWNELFSSTKNENPEKFLKNISFYFDSEPASRRYFLEYLDDFSKGRLTQEAKILGGEVIETLVQNESLMDFLKIGEIENFRTKIISIYENINPINQKAITPQRYSDHSSGIAVKDLSDFQGPDSTAFWNCLFRGLHN